VNTCPHRLLFITSEPPHTAAAGSIYFHRLFREYPADRLRVITNGSLPSRDQRLSCDYFPHRIWADRLQQTRFWKWRTAARVLGGVDFLSLSTLDRLAGDFRPDAVVTLMQNSWYYELAARYARARNLPLILFIHDLPHGFEPVAPWLRRHQLRRDRAIYEQAAVRFCVSPGMEAWFRREFGVPGEVLLPPSSPNPPSQDPKMCRTLKRPEQLTLGYAGGLHYGYGEQIAAMIPVLRATNTRLEIFGPTPSGKLAGLKEATDVLSFHGYAPTPEEAWSGLLARCDAVLLPYLNPPCGHHLQYQTHFPSKLGDMLALGLPLLITGPADASGVTWCQSNGLSEGVVTDQSAFEAMLAKLSESAGLRVQLANQAKKTAGTFDLNVLSAQLVSQLKNLI